MCSNKEQAENHLNNSTAQNSRNSLNISFNVLFIPIFENQDKTVKGLVKKAIFTGTIIRSSKYFYDIVGLIYWCQMTTVTPLKL